MRDIAIIGMAARLPEADDYQQFWTNLVNGRDSIRQLPVSRGQLIPGYDPNQEYQAGGFIEDIDRFDPIFFKILPTSAKYIDPVQRVMLEIVNHAIEDAGYCKEQLSHRKIGVFLSDYTPQYYQYLDDAGLDTLAGNLPANLAGRVAFLNGFTGPALTIDTACSSGLVALHFALESLRNGTCEMAVVGGSTIHVGLPVKAEGAFGVMSPTGKCRSFSKDADGTVGGEGIIAFLIKPLEKAMEDHDPIHAVIKGSAVNQDGARSNGLTAPSPVAQKEVIQEAWQNAGIDPTTISYIETHGSGTALGDPIEIAGLTDAFHDYTGETGFCALGAVKTNIGHLGNTAGLAGLLKTVLCLKYQQIPPIVHFTEPNPYIDFEHSSVFVNTELRDWVVDAGMPRRAGVSSFGLSGTNCHVVVEEMRSPKGSEIDDEKASSYQLIGLSGPTQNVVQQKLVDLQAYLQKHPDANLSDLSFTLLTGRKQYPQYRCGIVAKDPEELLQNLSTVQPIRVEKTFAEVSALFLLPDYQPAYAEYLTDLIDAQLADEKLLVECRQIIDDHDNPRVAFFVFEYLLAHLWMRAGIKPQGIVGIGVGQSVSAVLSKRITVAEGMAEAAADRPEKEVDDTKLRTFLEAQICKGRNLLIHFTEQSILADAVQQCISNRTDLLFCQAYGQPAAYTLIQALRKLYHHGIDIKWEAISSGRRMSLPTYPYEKESYWFKRTFSQEVAAAVTHHPVKESPDKVQPTGQDGERRPIDPSQSITIESISEILLGIWREYLGLNEMGMDDDFIEWGGDSIRGMLLMKEIHRVFGVTLDVAFLLQYGTVTALAGKIQEELDGLPSHHTEEKQVIPKVEPVLKQSDRSYFELSPSQNNLWLVHQIDPEEIAYNEPLAIKLRGPLQIECLHRALQTVIQRHGALRTFFAVIDGKPLQGVYAPEYSGQLLPKIDTVNVTDTPYDERMLEELVHAEAKKPFDFSKAPLFRAKLIKLQEDEYVFIMIIHHIICDGWSIMVLTREICHHYEAFVNGLEPTLPELTAQYYDFAHWQNELVKRGEFERAKRYWLDKFAGELPVLNLPTDYPRPAEKSYEGSSIYFDLPMDLSSRIIQLSKRSGTTLFVTMLTFFEVLLNKYTRQDELIIGTPSANRPSDALWNLIGFFVNTFAVRHRVNPEDSLASMMQRVREDLVESYSYANYPFTDLVSQLNLQRDVSRSALFDVMYVYHNVGSIERNPEQNLGDYGGITFESISRREIVSDYDLKIEWEERAEQFHGKIEYSTRLFTAETIERMIRHFQQLIAEVVADPEKKLAEISMLTEGEKATLLEAFNATTVDFADDQTLDQLFALQVEKSRSDLAVIYGDQQLTYQELDEQSNQLARMLQKQGVRQDQIVGIMVERSLEMMVGIFGIIKAGGAYLPIDPALPRERIQYMVEDSDPQLILVHGKTAHLLDGARQLLNLNEPYLYTAESKAKVENGTIPQGLAYVIYTSGSTGKPKGTMIEHRSLINRLQWMQKAYPLDPSDTILHKTPYSFDVSVWEIFWWSLYGAKVCLLEQGGEKEPQSIIDQIEQNQVTIMHFVPSMLTAFLDYLKIRATEAVKLRSLRHVFASGEALKRNTVVNFNEFIGDPYHVRFHNLYGPTEAAIDVSYFDCAGEIRGETVPIGYPIDNIKLYIVDAHLQLAPLGLPGEICIAGVGLARGYLNRPDLTREKFVQCPFIAGERMYRTGDLGRYLTDGCIEFLGRMDHQVKIRGFRIELGEIEAALVTHPAIREAVVLAKEDPTGDAQLVGYIESSQSLDREELRQTLLHTLPEYMVPSIFVFLDEMPHLPNGKINRHALPEPTQQIRTGTEYIAPTTAVEQKLAEIWTEILGVEQVGVNDHFFELGGHSLKATFLVANIYREFHVQLSLKDIFRMPTLKELAKYLEKAETNPYAAIEPITDGEYAQMRMYPVSSAQKRVYILQQFDRESTHYNMPGALYIEGDLNLNTLWGAFQQLVQRHESLRTSFHTVKGELLQKVHQKAELMITMREAGEAEIEQIIAGFIRPFDLSQAPLLRVELVKVPQRFVLIFDLHHIISDGISMNIFIKDFCDIYEGKELPELRIQYKDFSLWHNQFLLSAPMKQQEAYWLDRFAGGVPVLNLPTDDPRPMELSFEGDQFEFTLGRELTVSCKQFVSHSGATLYMVLLAAYQILLSKYTGQEEIVVGSPIAGRPHPDLANMIGMFVNTLVMRNDLERDQSLMEFLMEVQENALKAYENQDYPFETLVEKLGQKDVLQRDVSRNPVFDTMFVLQNMGSIQTEIEGLKFIPYPWKSKVAKLDLTFSVEEVEDDLQVSIEYCTRLFRSKTIERMAGHFMQILRQILVNPGCTLREVEWITEAEKAMLLYDWNQTQAEYPQKCIQQIFEEQVERTPDQIAVVFHGDQLTYRQFNEKANQLARVLREKGVTADQMVGLMVERSLEMVIGMMGIVKSGGAYLPIDPEYPPSRIQWMLEDSQARLLLTQDQWAEEIPFAGEIISLEDKELYTGDGSNLELVNQHTDLAYVLYTSGTTGQPKGVMVEHHSVVNLLCWFNEQYDLQTHHQILQLTNYTFDPSVEEIFGALLYGATLFMIPRELLANRVQTRQLIQDHQIQILNGVPSLFKEILIDAVSLPSVKIVISGGERLDEVVKDQIVQQGYQLYNHYGPTEATVDALVARCSNETVSIGQPISNVRCYILDQELHPVPIGIPGELYLAGAGLARGYLHQPDLTAEKFIANPLIPGERMYRTGDLACWLPDGHVRLFGRVDRQVKVSGNRIELGEIESHLLRIRGIHDAIVLDHEDAQGETYLVAYLVADPGICIEDVRAQVANELPLYMVPAFFIPLTHKPLTDHGKIDRKALPRPDRRSSPEKGYVAPTTRLEERLAMMWSEVLGVERVGVKSNFFELGGHSLSATSVIAKISQEFHVKIPLRQFFKTPTVHELAKYILAAEKSRYSVIEPVEKRSVYPVSSAQKRLYIVHQFDVESTNYNMPGVMYIEGNLHPDSLQQAFTNLVRRHESLRTSFHMVDGQIVQRIHPDVALRVQWMEAEEDEVHEQVVNFIRPFDLSTAPLIRVGVIRLPERYLLIYDMHHLISDGISMNLLIHDFICFYQGQPLPELRIQYKDFAVWQNNLLNSEPMKEQEAYWLETFAGEIPTLNLPIDSAATGARPLVKSFQGRQMNFTMGEEFTSQCNQLAVTQGVTWYMLLLSAYNILLAKYAGQEDIIIGSPIAGRSHADAENVIGMFVNTLAMRNAPCGEKPFADFLREVKENAVKAFENQSYPFDTLVERLDQRNALSRDLSRNPLFDVMFALHNTDSIEETPGEWKIQPYEWENTTAKFDLTLHVTEIAHGMLCSFEYCTDLFTEDTITRLAGHYLNILQQVVQNPGILIADIELLSAEEKEQLLVEWNDTAAGYPESSIIQEIFQEQVRRQGTRTAVVYEGQSISYQHLNQKANQFARHLRAKGVQADTIVGIMVERSLELIMGIMGILKAGGAYVPIDPAYPEERIDYLLKDSQMEFLVTDGVSQIPFTGEVLNLHDAGIYTGDDSDLAVINQPHHLAYVIYTSGSTGKPKGVMIEHRNLIRLFLNERFQFDFDSDDVWTMFHSPCFDFSVWEIFGALLYGGKLVVIPRLVAQNPGDYLDVLQKEKVTIVNQTPTAFYHLSAVEMKAEKKELHVRYIIVGGEALKPMMLKAWKERYPETRLINMYGITETTVHVTAKELSIDDLESKISNIGKPIPTLKAYVLDPHQRLLPIGVPGELCVAGAGVGRGYLHRPELTEEKFIPNPLSPDPGEERLYRSGDLVRILENGDIEYLGRIDRQVKIRGFRIELGEIENQLIKHPYVQDGVVVDRDDQAGEKYLVAYVVADGEQGKLSGTELRAFLQTTLPEYMIPTYFIQIDQIPLTVNGKVNRNALPEVDGTSVTRAEYVAPTTETETRLVQIWSEILGIEQIGVTDNFFEIGGHSLKATKLVSWMQKEMAVEIHLRDIFQSPTIAELAHVVRQRECSIYREIPPLPEGEDYELSFSQQRLWIIHQLEPESVAYHMASVVTFTEDVNPEGIREVFERLVERHESLRTIFTVVAGRPVQRIRKELELPFVYTDLSGMSDPEKNVKRNRIYSENSQRPFDLETGPLFRVSLVKINETEVDLIYVMHHMISDGWSMEVLQNEFIQCYRALQAGQEHPLPELPIQYKDFAAWQNQLLTDEDRLQEVISFWAEQWEGELPVLHLPYDSAQTHLKDRQSAAYRWVIPADIQAPLQDMAIEYHASLFMILLAGFQLFLARITHQTDLMLGIPAAGREHDSLKHVMGCFINTLILRNRFSPEETFAEFLQKVQDQTLQALEYQVYPLELIFTRLKMEYPKISVFFNMLNFQNQNQHELADLRSYHIEEVQDVKFDLVCYLTEYRNGIEVTCHYLTGLFEPETIAYIMEEYRKLLGKIAENPDRNVVEYLEWNERRRILL